MLGMFAGSSAQLNGIAGRLDKIEEKQDRNSEAQNDRSDAIETRLDRWDGAILFIKAAASFLGLGGLALLLAALARSVPS
jgi:hypothetical protein